MSGNKFLIDTNIIIYILNGDVELSELLYLKDLYISFITELELLSLENISEKQKVGMELFINQCKVVDINEDIKSLVIFIRKQKKIKLPDSIIAATAKYLNIPLVTSDKSFAKIENFDCMIY
ncbi:MAG: type II toxin-antitoxin system VapC family toxin [Chitinophagales bacterium]|nr:type II toxin-antitoxin system VapC family toxin [Chitinophagales bacterium]